MSNPYHDAEGKFCSRDEMQSAIQQLADSKNLDLYLGMREAFDATEAPKEYTPYLLDSEEYEHTVRIPNAFGDWTLIKGKLDRKAAAALTSGPCPNFAEVLHKKTGWPYVAAVEKGYASTSAKKYRENWDEQDSGMWHVMVQRPDGKLVDASGVQSAEEYMADAKKYKIDVVLYPVTAKYVKAHHVNIIDNKHLESFADEALKLSEQGKRVPGMEEPYSE
jgi:hypothetical protein